MKHTINVPVTVDIPAEPIARLADPGRAWDDNISASIHVFGPKPDAISLRGPDEHGGFGLRISDGICLTVGHSGFTAEDESRYHGWGTLAEQAEAMRLLEKHAGEIAGELERRVAAAQREPMFPHDPGDDPTCEDEDPRPVAEYAEYAGDLSVTEGGPGDEDDPTGVGQQAAMELPVSYLACGDQVADAAAHEVGARVTCPRCGETEVISEAEWLAGCPVPPKALTDAALAAVTAGGAS